MHLNAHCSLLITVIYLFLLLLGMRVVASPQANFTSYDDYQSLVKHIFSTPQLYQKLINHYPEVVQKLGYSKVSFLP